MLACSVCACVCVHSCAALCREFISKRLPSFAKENPQTEVSAELKRGKHPALFGTYGVCVCRTYLICAVLKRMHARCACTLHGRMHRDVHAVSLDHGLCVCVCVQCMASSGSSV